MSGLGEQIEVAVNQISIEDLRQQPYKAVLTYEKSYYAQTDHQLKGHATFTAHIQFVVMDKVPINLVPVNPLGLTVTYLREDQAFTDDSSPSSSPGPLQRRTAIEEQAPTAPDDTSYPQDVEVPSALPPPQHYRPLR
jgi:hypothetical protein